MQKPSVMQRAIVGQVIAQHRQARGMSQQALAEKLHVNQATLSRFEAGQSSMTIEQIGAAAAAFGLNRTQLLAQVDNLANQLRAAGHVVLDGPEKDEGGSLAGAALIAAFVLLLLSSKN